MQLKRTILSRAAGVTAIAAAACVPHFATAQSSARESVFVDLGRWTIYQQPAQQRCVLRLSSNNGASLAYTKSRRSPARLSLQVNRRLSNPFGEVIWAFDGDEFQGQTSGGQLYSPLADSGAIAAAFRKARFLNVRHGGVTIASVSLKTSSAGYRLLDQCADQWRPGFAPLGSRWQRPASQEANPPVRISDSSLASTRAAQTRAQTAPPPPPPPPPPSLASPPVPRNSSGWIRGEDYRRLQARDWNGGELRFSLVVNPRGRVDDCVVTRSSGSSEFDALTCKNLERRARFDPARDNGGNTTRGSYSSSIRYEVPD